MSALQPAYDNLIVTIEAGVGLVQLNRPQALNAFNDGLMNDLTHALEALDADPQIGAIVLTGSDKAFAAGADIKDMADLTASQAFAQDFITRNWEAATRCRTPVLACVRGVALGGGCELAMMCDMIFAADNARFGQPEIRLGVIPGAGGTQRLARWVGKAKAMDLILTGRMMDAAEAERAGLVARVFPADTALAETLGVARQIAAFSRQAVRTAKEAVNRAFETSLCEGVLFERRTFYALFGTPDQKEGMAAFIEKRPAQFNKDS